ncbi:TrbI/VirB10 family protein [Chroococcus sp. FPU101]|uniref:TrbI/VirB10 family protein n=1 Tax=Chroococcus sp. FPU101 TaxID=1974212 RepID=UPI001A8C640A|nr:TrbI/VirB10 family protein [Chroococcus sp. FPU101]GFE72158.1 hypothetical protein CFPU101_47680 [Chroococcus sp. FPU101]
MPKTEQLPDELEQLLFDGELKKSLKPRESISTIDLDELQPVPYYKKPLIQAAFLAAVGLPIMFVLFSSFSSAPPSTKSASPEQEKALADSQRLQDTINKLREENQTLTISKGIKDQQTEFVKVNNSQTKPQEPSAPTRPVAVAQPPQPARPIRTVAVPPTRSQSVPIRTVYVTRTIPERPVVASNEPRRVVPVEKASAPPLPSPNLDDVWISRANQGLYFAPNSSNNLAVAPNPVATPEVSNSTDSLSEIYSSRSTAVGKRMTETEDPASNLLDIGSSAEARLESGIAWTEDGKGQERKYLLRLEQGFRNRQGVEVLPKGTLLIAQMVDISQSGLFSMKVTQIIRSSGEKIPVPSGSLPVVDEDGSPLKASLERKGGASFWTKFGTAIAPGLQRGMESLANTGESLLLQDGDRSVIRSSGSSNPLASGLSGVADGASRVFLSQLEQGKNERAAPYFQFDGGQTVRVMVNEDLML